MNISSSVNMPCYVINTRKLTKPYKVSKLLLDLISLNIIFAFVTETWYDENFNTSFFENNGYKAYRADRTDRGHGGSMLLINKSYESSLVVETSINCPTSISDIITNKSFKHTDHFTVHFSLNLDCVSSLNSSEDGDRYIDDFFNADYDKVSELLDGYDWDVLLSACNDVNEQYMLFLSIYNEICSKCIGKKIVKNKYRLPWCNRELHRLMRRRDRAWTKYLHSGRRNDKLNKYCKLSRRTIALNDSLRESYELQLANSNNMKKLCKYVNSHMKFKSRIPSLLVNDNNISDHHEKAELFAKVFKSHFTVDDGNNLRVNNKKCDVENVCFSESVIIDALKNIKTNSPAGPDLINPYFVSKTIKAIAKPLSIIFKNSYSSGSVPYLWKLANVSPVYKKGPPNLVENYRPVSITCLTCRVMESIIRRQWIRILIDEKIISYEQFGFISEKSCETQLLDCLNKWCDLVDKGMKLHCIYFDLSRAFDTVPHSKLLNVLRSFGINNCLFDWIKSFLTERKFRVKIHNQFSEWYEVTSGVPQGSVLGPLLFLLYINDLPRHIKFSIIRLFADDIKLFPHTSLTPVDHNTNLFNYEYIQKDVDSIVNYLNERQLILNSNKCVVLKINTDECVNIKIEQSNLNCVDEIKDLGIIIDSQLKFSTQCAKTVSKARKICGMILHSFQTKKVEILMKAFDIYVLPILLYCSTVWSPRLVSDQNNLESVQKSFTWRVMKIHDYKNRLANLNRLTIIQRHLVRDICVTNDIFKGNVNLDVKCFFDVKKAFYDTRSHKYFIIQRKHSLDVLYYFFSHRVVNNWNNLPTFVVDIENRLTFKNHVKNIIPSL